MVEQSVKIKITVLLILSVVAFFTPGLIAFIKTKFLSEKRRKSDVGVMIIFSAFLIAAIWCLRYAVAYCCFITENSTNNLNMLEEAVNCFLATLRTFNLEEMYVDYLSDIKTMFGNVYSEKFAYFKEIRTLLVVYASILNVAAPIAGGAVIFEILASVFPKVKMELSYFAVWRKKFFFSEINEASISLAKGILDVNKSYIRRPVLIFTDTYVDKENEKKAELLSEAKSFGSICVKDDISHVRKNMFGSRSFMLLDENESSNLQALTDLSGKRNIAYMKKAKIFFVTTSDAYLEIEQRVHDKIVNEYEFKEEDIPTFIPVKCYRNLVSNLLVEIPLFEPLIDKKRKDELMVTILGTGHIGIEMFLTTYWIGQILNCALNINVVSEESEKEFWNKIDYINPEIKHTTKLNDPILRINRQGDMASPYCTVNYFCCDAKSSTFMDYITESSLSGNLLNTDYFFVSLGTDDLNISVANTIKNAVGKYHISKEDAMKTVIAYVVYDSTVSEILNRKCLFNFAGKTADILMRAVGNTNEVYSAKNIFLNDYEITAQKIHSAYLKAQGLKSLADVHKDRMVDDYKHWANLARSMHIKYKMFSMGIVYDSIFNYDNWNEKNYIKSVEVALDRYKRKVSGKTDFEKTEDFEKHLKLLNELAWLEHRRWNAFTRVKGFKHTNDYDNYAIAGETGSYKQMELKLHPCLVECDKKGIRAEFNEKGKIIENSIFKRKDKTDFDLLDELSYDLYEKRYNNFDFKQYDYPVSDF